MRIHTRAAALTKGNVMIEFETDEQLAGMLADGTCKVTALRDMAKNNQAGLTEAALRYMFANRDDNGFSDAFIKLGSSVYIIDHRFWRCVIRNQGRRLDGGRREHVLAEASKKSKENAKAREANAPAEA